MPRVSLVVSDRVWRVPKPTIVRMSASIRGGGRLGGQLVQHRDVAGGRRCGCLRQGGSGQQGEDGGDGQ